MTLERIKEIQQETAYPNSVSVQQALLTVWNECEQERVKNCSIPAVSGQREQCNHVFQRVERGGEFQGNQCECGEWEDLT